MEGGINRYPGRSGGSVVNRRREGVRGKSGQGDGSLRLTSVSVGGLVEHEHGIVDLGGRQTTQFF